MKNLLAIVSIAFGVGLLVASVVPTNVVWAGASGQVFWNAHEADLFLHSRVTGWRGVFGERALRLAAGYLGGSMPVTDERFRSFVVRYTADGVKTYETEDVFFPALTVFEGRIQAGAQWIWTGSQFVRASFDQQQRFVAAQVAAADMPRITLGGWSQRMLFRGPLTEVRATIDGRPLTITSSFDDDGQRVTVAFGGEAKQIVLFAPELKTGLSRSEYEQLLTRP